MNLKEELRSIQASMQNIIDRSKAENRGLTAKEAQYIESKGDEAIKLRKRMDDVEKSEASLAEIVALGAGDDGLDGTGRFLAFSGTAAKTAGSRIGAQIREQYGQKALTGTGAITTSVPLVPQNPIELGKVPTSFLDVIPAVQRQTPAYRYLRQTAFVNNAAIVAADGTKPTSTMTVEPIDGALSVFAHLSEPVDKYLLLDNDTLASFIANQLLWGLRAKLEAEYISGAGTAGTLQGIDTTTGVQQQGYGADKVTTLRSAATKLEVAGHTTGAYVLNPSDWETIETTRSTSGGFDLGGPVNRAERKVWGTQVVTSTAVAAGVGYAIDTTALGVDAGAEGVHIQWDAGGALFDKNQIRARVEGRFGITVAQPAGVVKIDLSAAV